MHSALLSERGCIEDQPQQAALHDGPRTLLRLVSDTAAVPPRSVSRDLLVCARKSLHLQSRNFVILIIR